MIVHIVCKGRELAQRLGESLVHKQLDDLVSWTHPEADRAIDYVPADYEPAGYEDWNREERTRR